MKMVKREKKQQIRNAKNETRKRRVEGKKKIKKKTKEKRKWKRAKKEKKKLEKYSKIIRGSGKSHVTCADNIN